MPKKKQLAKRKLEAEVRPVVLLEFIRNLVRETHNGDVLKLVLAQTKAAGATDEEVAALHAAIRQEQAASLWPKGFMTEFE